MDKSISRLGTDPKQPLTGNGPLIRTVSTQPFKPLVALYDESRTSVHRSLATAFDSAQKGII